MVYHLHIRTPMSDRTRRMKRNPRKVRWTKAFRKAAGKEMTIVSLSLLRSRSTSNPTLSSGLHYRIREEEKRPRPLRPRARADYGQGDEEDSGDQVEERACILEEQVRLKHISCQHILVHSGGPQDARGEGEAQGTPKAQAREDLCQACPAPHSPDREGQGEDQGPSQGTQRVGCWRGPVHGHGCRLRRPIPFLVRLFFFPPHHVVMLCGHPPVGVLLCNVHVHAMRYVPGNVYWYGRRLQMCG